MAGDRRATAGNIVMYDRADKVLEIDRHSVMAIAGSPATAWEMARILEHSFQFYRRSQLQEMSVEGKVRVAFEAVAGQSWNGDAGGWSCCATIRNLRQEKFGPSQALLLRRDGRPV